MMHSEMGWITKHVRSDCHRGKVVLPCVELLVYWKAVEGTATLISSENPRILSVQSLEAHQRFSIIYDLFWNSSLSSIPCPQNWNQVELLVQTLKVWMVPLFMIPCFGEFMVLFIWILSSWSWEAVNYWFGQLQPRFEVFLKYIMD